MNRQYKKITENHQEDMKGVLSTLWIYSDR